MISLNNLVIKSSNSIKPLALFIPEDSPFPTVQIGNQIWMSKNLEIDDGSAGITVVNNVNANNVDFGTQYYYTWDAANRVANSIPGWHLPTKEEWQTLLNIDATTRAFRSTEGWNSGGNGTNISGMNIYPTGWVEPWGTTGLWGTQSRMWSSSIDDPYSNPWQFYFNYQSPLFSWENDKDSFYRMSVRLIKD